MACLPRRAKSLAGKRRIAETIFLAEFDGPRTRTVAVTALPG
jgi:hypothetical protein